MKCGKEGCKCAQGGTEQDNLGFEFTDTLPADLELISAQTDTGNLTTSGNTVNLDLSLSANQSATVHIVARILSDELIRNQGNLSFDSDGNGNNDQSAFTDDPNLAGTDDPTVFRVTLPPSESIPLFMLPGLLLMIATFGTVLGTRLGFRRRR